MIVKLASNPSVTDIRPNHWLGNESRLATIKSSISTGDLGILCEVLMLCMHAGPDTYHQFPRCQCFQTFIFEGLAPEAHEKKIVSVDHT